MKRTISLLLILVAVLSFLPLGTANAEQNSEQKEIIPLEDGAYIEVTIESVATIASGTVTKNKNYTYYTSDGSVEWKITLTGTFIYNGTTSTCTASSCSVTIYNSNWYAVSKSTTKSGNTAYATVTMGLRYLGITVTKQTYNITLTCDKDGNVS